jgi:hypothetical protein
MGNHFQPSVKKFFLYSLLYLLAIFLCYPGLFIHFSTALIRGDMGDLKNMLGIISFTINSPITQIFHLPIFYPLSSMLTQTHPLFGVSLFFKLFNVAGLSLIQSVNLYIILSLFSGAWGCFLFAREFCLDKRSIFPYLFSFIYIFFSINHLHFVWLNFLSRFYIPFILFFMIKFLKTNKKIYALWIVIFSLLQFLASIYYGVFLWILVIPLFIVLAMFLKIIPFYQIRYLLYLLLIGSLLIMLVFYPYITHNTPAVYKSDFSLTTIPELFSGAKILTLFLGDTIGVKQNLFPGFFFTVSILLFFFSFVKRFKLSIGLMAIAISLVMSLLVYLSHHLLNLSFLLLLSWLLYICVSNWKQISSWDKLIVLWITAISVFLIQLRLPFTSTSIMPFGLFSAVLPIGGLHVLKRVFVMLLPFTVVLASVGAERFIVGQKKKAVFFSPAHKLAPMTFLILLLILAAENVRNPFIYLLNSGEDSVMKVLPKVNPLYKHLPANPDKVLLEIPFYFRRRLKNADYMLNFRFHQSHLLNGKVSFLPRTYYRKLSSVIGMYHLKFPDENSLKCLIQDYSVDYVIIHRDRLIKYQSIHRTPVDWNHLLERVKATSGLCDIVYRDSGHIVLHLKEKAPITEIVRTYSKYHLHTKGLNVQLSNVFEGKIDVFLNHKHLYSKNIKDSQINLTFHQRSLLRNGNKIKVLFPKPVLVKKVHLNPL